MNPGRLLFQFPGFANLQVSLAAVGGFDGIHAGPEFGFFQEVAPAFMGVGRGLTILVFAHGGFCVLAAVDHLDHSGGLVGTDVVADEGVGRSGFVAGQSGSVFQGNEDQGTVRRVPVLSFQNGPRMRLRVGA